MNLANEWHPCSKESQLFNSTDSPSVNKKKLRKQIIERDGDWCLLCGRPKGGLQIHRVVYGSSGGLYVLENCVQLCIFCHNPIVHANKKKWQPLLLNYLKDLVVMDWKSILKEGA